MAERLKANPVVSAAQIQQYCLVVIPAKNEALTIAEVVAEVREQGFAVVVIDDASTDQTAVLARQAGAEVVSLLFTIGAWNAMQTGFRYALKKGYRYCVTLDADGQHPADALPALLKAADDCDVVIGAFPQRADLSRQLAWKLFKKLSGIDIHDVTSGLRLYNKTAMLLLAARKATLIDFQDIGVLLLIQAHGLRIRETPVHMRKRQDRSRIFYSWQRVLYYMAYTLLLSLSKRVRKQHSEARLII